MYLIFDLFKTAFTLFRLGASERCSFSHLLLDFSARICIRAVVRILITAMDNVKEHGADTCLHEIYCDKT